MYVSQICISYKICFVFNIIAYDIINNFLLPLTPINLHNHIQFFVFGIFVGRFFFSSSLFMISLVFLFLLLIWVHCYLSTQKGKQLDGLFYGFQDSYLILETRDLQCRVWGFLLNCYSEFEWKLFENFLKIFFRKCMIL